MSSGVLINILLPSAYAKNAMMNNPTEKGGTASVNHSPTEKMSRNKT